MTGTTDDPKILRALQLRQYEALKDLSSFCDQNGIAYFLDSGTLLGAVRHGGFIPWDDDVDVCMDAKSYHRFLKLAGQFSDKYYVQNYRWDPTMRKKWTKVRVNSTTVHPVNWQPEDTHCGACLDVFVIAGYAKTRLGRAIQQFADRILSDMLKKKKRSGIHVWISRVAERMLLLDTLHGNQALSTFYAPGSRLIPAAAFDPDNRKRMPFEDGVFYAPGDWETVLEYYYEDWRTPPDVSERTGHGALFVDLEHGWNK